MTVAYPNDKDHMHLLEGANRPEVDRGIVNQTVKSIREQSCCFLPSPINRLPVRQIQDEDRQPVLRVHRCEST